MASLSFTSIGNSDDASNTTESTKVVASSLVFTIEVTEEEMLHDKLSKLFVEENGIKYLIELDDNELLHVELMISGACDRIGILPTTTNKMHDLVCDRSGVLSWDIGKLQYAFQTN